MANVKTVLVRVNRMLEGGVTDLTTEKIRVSPRTVVDVYGNYTRGEGLDPLFGFRKFQRLSEIKSKGTPEEKRKERR